MKEEAFKPCFVTYITTPQKKGETGCCKLKIFGSLTVIPMNHTKTEDGFARTGYSGANDTHTQEEQNYQPEGNAPAAWFFAGMRRFALAGKEHTVVMAKLAAAAGIGIFIGVFCYFFFGAQANQTAFAADYAAMRAFLSYPSVSAYIQFIAGWFCHHAVWFLGAMFAALTVYPGFFCAFLCALRGVIAGFSVCALSNGFSLFGVFYAAAQGALCAFLLMACTKAITYAKERRALPRTGHKQWTLYWMCGDVAPLLCGILFPCAAQICGMLLISAVCCFI